MNLRFLALAACAACGAGLAVAAEPAAANPPRPLLIADFEDANVLDRIVVTKSASITLSDQDVVSGKHCLEVRVKPFSTHGDPWPYVFLIDRYFTTPLDLSRYSRVVASVRNVTAGLATVQFTLSSKPYNDGGRNLEGEGFVIPGGSTTQCALPTGLFRRPMNDPSSVQALMFVFPPNETDAIYRIDAIQALYDPALGSPAEKLAKELTAGADGLLVQVQGLERQVNWTKVPAERAAALRRRIPELEATLRDLQQRAEVAAREGWKGDYNANRDALDAISRSLGEFAVADKVGFHLWQRPRYSYARRDALPTFASPALERFDLAMAQNEFRDAAWMVTACGREVRLQVEVTSPEPGLAEALQLRWSDFVTPAGLTRRITQMLQAWRAAPGQERLRWVFALSDARERLLADTSVAFLSDPWQRVFGQWLARFRDVVKSAGIADEDWMFVLADESSESALATCEIPFAEMIKRLDPKIALTCNASQVINDKALAERYFRVFDFLQPCLDSLQQSPPLREFLGVNRRPLWTYRCQAMAGLDKNLYDYYRVYAWENLRYGIVGTGIWTYCAQGESPWSRTQRGIAYNLVFKRRDKAEVVHSRRYEFYREGLDDYRYVQALLAASRKRGAQAEQAAAALVREAIADITADVGDVTRAERWRLRLAERILAFGKGTP
jgi:hypothetical protein